MADYLNTHGLSRYTSGLITKLRGIFALHGETATDEQVATAVTDWLDTNVDPVGSAVAVDASLLIEGAAADAKKTGEEITDLKNALSTNTYNLVIGKIEYLTIDSVGKFASNASVDVWIAPVENGKTYTVKTVDVSGLVCAFYTTNPLASLEIQSYNNSRTIQASLTITAPIDGYIAFRATHGETEIQIVEGSEDKSYIPPITANDFYARQSIDEITPEVSLNTEKLDDFTTIVHTLEPQEDYTITDNYLKATNGTDTASTLWEYATLSVSTGELYKIQCYAGQNSKPWLVLNGSSVIAYSSKTSAVSYTMEYVTIPTGATALVVNNRKADGDLYIDKIISSEYAVDGNHVYIDDVNLPDYINGNSNILYGKVLCCCGDSITYGADMDADGITNASNITVYQSNGSGEFTEVVSGFLKTWCWQIASRNNMTLYNAGVTGSTMQGISERSGFSLVNGRYTKLPDNIDYLLIWFGWNDTAHGTLGTIDDDTNESYYGGYNVVIPYLQTKYPHAKIGLIVPFGCDANHRNAVRLLGDKWGLAVWDNYKGGTPLYYGKEADVGVNEAVVSANQTKFQANGAHPNYQGHKQLGDMIENWMKGI